MNGEIISIKESRDLIRLERTIAKGRQTFVDVGEALAEIRNRRLYRVEYATFADYLETKWGISRSRASRLIQSAETVKALPVGNKPANERQARPLAKLPPKQRAEAWNVAVKASQNGTPTAKSVEAEVARRTGKQPEVTKTPLQWLTHWWLLASEEDHRLFDNFRAGLGVAR